MLNVISTCRDILCVDINVDKRCVDHSTTYHAYGALKSQLSLVKLYAQKVVLAELNSWQRTAHCASCTVFLMMCVTLILPCHLVIPRDVYYNKQFLTVCIQSRHDFCYSSCVITSSTVSSSYVFSHCYNPTITYIDTFEAVINKNLMIVCM